MIKDSLQQLIFSYKFDEAKTIFNDLDKEKQDEILSLIAYDNDSMLIYAFLCYVLYDANTAYLHNLTSVIMSTALCHIEGAYQTAFFHAKKAIELAPYDLNYKEFLLFFYVIPEKLLSQDEAVTIANEILLKMDSKPARQILNEVQ